MASSRSLTKITGGSGSVIQSYGSPDPYQNVSDPQHWKEVSSGIRAWDCLKTVIYNR
jgi:hypothetical protein